MSKEEVQEIKKSQIRDQKIILELINRLNLSIDTI